MLTHDHSAVLVKRCARAQQRSADLVAAARDLRHTCQILRASESSQRDRRSGLPVAAPAWFALMGLVDGQVVRALLQQGRLSCDRPLEARARLLVDLGEQFISDDPPRCYQASLQAPPVAVALTLLRACDRILRVELDIDQLTAP